MSDLEKNWDAITNEFAEQMEIGSLAFERIHHSLSESEPPSKYDFESLEGATKHIDELRERLHELVNAQRSLAAIRRRE